jgi:translation initiation factor 4E
MSSVQFYESIKKDSTNTLNSTWVLWYHDIKNTEWTLESYIRIAEFNTIEDFWKLYLNIKPDLITNGMFFLMRDAILPIWEDKNNINGGYWSFKISINHIHNAWNEISIALIGENILKDKTNIYTINGISISPKKNFCIIKIWNSDTLVNTNAKDILNKNILLFNFEEALYKSHNTITAE